MGTSARINNIDYHVNNPIVLQFAEQGQRMVCPECQKADLVFHQKSYRRSSTGLPIEVSAYFSTAPSSVHAEYCGYSSSNGENKSSLLQQDKPIRIFDRDFYKKFFSAIMPSAQNSTILRPNNNTKPSEKNQEPKISSLPKFVSFIEDTIENPQLKEKRFLYRNRLFSLDDIYYDAHRTRVLYENELKHAEFQRENMLVFALLKADSNKSLEKPVRGSYKYKVHCKPFSYTDESGDKKIITPKVNFKDKETMQTFRFNGNNVVWAVPRANKDSLEFDIMSKSQIAQTKPQVRQLSLF